MREQVEQVLAEIRPHLLADGGDVELVAVEDGVVKIKLTGACSGCPMRSMTIENGIGRYLKEKLPEVQEVVAV